MAANPEKKKRSVAGRVFSMIGKIIGTILLVGVFTTLIFACLFAKYVKDDLSKQADFSVDGFSLQQTSVIYYTDPNTGEPVELQQLYGEENRTWVSYQDIPKNLRFACIAIEDKRFYDHQGVDWLRTIKASLNMFVGGNSTYGGSTLTQQLIKNLTDEDEVTVRRKLVEIFRALDFEKKHSKEEILEWYFNTIYLGEGCYGVQSASRVYFGKDVSELTLAECASLIGITNNPSIYDPYINPEKNRSRQLLILDAMRKQGYILSQAEYDAAVDQELVFVNNSADNQDSDNNAYFSYFTDQVIRDVIADLRQKTGYSEKIVAQMVRAGGYSIYCTLDPSVQQQVDNIYQNLDNIPKTASSQQLESGIVVIDNQSGDVVAMAGGVGEKTGSLTLNRATQSLLSPGSTIKPITVYAPALDKGLVTPATVYDDTPYSFTGSGRWPKNTDNIYRGLTTVNSAVSLSLNTVAVKIVADLTPEYSFRFAQEKMGMDTLVKEEVINGQTFTDIGLASLALGGLTHGVTVQDMATAYATFANQGQYRQSRTYTKVVDASGKVVLDNTQKTVDAMSTKAAWYMTYMLQYAVEHGTGSPAKLENMTVAGKTGTTTSDYDRWFCGFTPYYTAAVWCGYDEPEEVVLTDSSTNPSVYLWQKVMAGIHNGLENKSFPQPTDVVSCTYCRDSGLLATDACKNDIRGSRVVSGMLAMEDIPTSYCNVHKYVEICAESGEVANEYCSQVEGNEIKTVGLLNLMRAFPLSGIVVQDQQYTYYRDSEIPSGYYPAVSPTGRSYGQVCTVHTEESLLPKEEPTPPNGVGDLETPGGEGSNGNSGDPTQPPTDYPIGDGPNGGHENPDDGGAVPND